MEDIILTENITKVITEDEEIHLDETCNNGSEIDDPNDHDDK